jgi:XTP/dITP diphosphohydrolase
MTTFLIATRNAHKVGEIRAILGAAFDFLTLNDFPGAPPVDEDADTFAGNATKKAVTLAHWLATQPAGGQRARPDYVLADDSGLEVDALKGAPGVHSARFAAAERKGNAPDADNNAKLLRLLQTVPTAQRTARFRCVIAIAPVAKERGEIIPPATQLFEGACEGRIQLAPSGRSGFGYDPLFIPRGFDQSFAELGEDTKNRLSHRGQALSEMKARFHG